jgi:hypothetical protein
MSHHAAAPFLEAKIAVAFYTTAAVAIGVGLVRAEGLGPGLIFGCLPLLALGYSLYGRSFATWPWRATSNRHRALWFVVVVCELLGLALLLAGTVA